MEKSDALLYSNISRWSIGTNEDEKLLDNCSPDYLARWTQSLSSKTTPRGFKVRKKDEGARSLSATSSPMLLDQSSPWPTAPPEAGLEEKLQPLTNYVLPILIDSCEATAEKKRKRVYREKPRNLPKTEKFQVLLCCWGQNLRIKASNILRPCHRLNMQAVKEGLLPGSFEYHAENCQFQGMYEILRLWLTYINNTDVLSSSSNARTSRPYQKDKSTKHNIRTTNTCSNHLNNRAAFTQALENSSSILSVAFFSLTSSIESSAPSNVFLDSAWPSSELGKASSRPRPE